MRVIENVSHRDEDIGHGQDCVILYHAIMNIEWDILSPDQIAAALERCRTETVTLDLSSCILRVIVRFYPYYIRYI